MLFITLIAVWLGVFRLAPGLAIAAAVLAAPALVRTTIYSSRRRAAGQATSMTEKFAAFAGSVGVVLAICVGAFAAFGAVCFGAFWVFCAFGPPRPGTWIERNPATVLVLWIGASAAIGLAVGGLIAWKLWPRLK